MEATETILFFAAGLCLFVVGIGLGAYLENIRLTSIYFKTDRIMGRIIDNLKLQEEAEKENQSTSFEQEEDWSVRITQELPEISGEYPQA